MAGIPKIVIGIEGGCLRTVWVSTDLYFKSVKVRLVDFDDLKENHDETERDRIWEEATEHLKPIW